MFSYNHFFDPVSQNDGQRKSLTQPRYNVKIL